MEYRMQVKWSIILTGLALVVGLAGCEGPGPEYQTPMAAYPEMPDNSLPVETVKSPKMAYEEIYREQKAPDLRTVLLLDSGKTQITSGQKRILKQQASYLKQNPKATIQIKGYTDAKSKAILNKKMISLNTNQIAKFLKVEGISANRIETVPFETKPHSKNRCVELVILPEGKLTKS